jgi:GNAT superfamily N-acetyltransferase
MPITRKRRSLSAAGSDFLTAELKAIARSSPSLLQRRANRIAVTYRPRKQGRDAIPDRPIPIEDFRLLAVSYRWCDDPRRGPRWRAALGSYQANLDFPGSGRVVFRCEQAWDLTSPHPLLYPRPNYTAIRAAVLLQQAIQDADPRDLATGLHLPEFSFGFDPDRLPRFDPIDLPAAHAAERAIDGLRAWPAELFSRDGQTTLDRRPCRVFASLADLKGRLIRNPSFAVLQNHGILPARVGYKAWLSTVRVSTGRSRVFQDPRARGTELARIRKVIEDHVLADPARESRLLADVAEACHAMGIKFADGSVGIDALAELVDNPWSRPAVPYAARVQVLKLAGSPGPATMSFADGATDVDLFDLGPDRDRFRPVSSEGTRR